MQSALEHPDIVERYLGGENQAGRLLGPFNPGQIEDLHISRFGVIRERFGQMEINNRPIVPGRSEYKRRNLPSSVYSPLHVGGQGRQGSTANGNGGIDG